MVFLRGGDMAASARETVERCLEAWVATFSSPNTRQAYRNRLRTWFRWCAEQRIPPLAATLDEIDAFAVSQRSNATTATVRTWHRWLTAQPAAATASVFIEPADLKPTCKAGGCTNVAAIDGGVLCLTCINEAYQKAGLRRHGVYTSYHSGVAVGCLNCPWTGEVSLATLQKPNRPADLPGCRSCSYRRRGERRRTPVDEAYQEFWDAGYEMIGEFTGVDDPVEAICLEHQVQCRPRLKQTRTQRDRSCRLCSSRARSERKRTYSQEDIRQILLTGNMELTGTFRTVSEPVLARCLTSDCRKQSKVWVASILRGGTCRFCARRGAAASERLPLAVVTTAVNNVGFDLLSEYINNHTLMKLRCRRCMHAFPRSYKSLRKGASRCPACDPVPPSRPTLDEEEVRAIFLARSLRMTGVYTGFHNPVTAECIACGNVECTPTLANLRSGQGGCRICGNERIGDAIRTPLDTVIAIMDAADIDFIGPFRTQTDSTPGRHRRCGNVVKPRINSLIFGGGGCMACGYAKRRVPWTSAADIAGNLYLLDFNLDGERFCKVGIGKIGSGRIKQFQTHCGAHVRQVITASLAACYAAEQAILAAHRDDAYLPINPCLISGHTECFYHRVQIDLHKWLPKD